MYKIDHLKDSQFHLEDILTNEKAKKISRKKTPMFFMKSLMILNISLIN